MPGGRMKVDMVKIAVEEGLCLKSVELQDAEQLLLLIDSSRPYLRQWLPWLDVTRNIDEILAFIDSAQRQLDSNAGFQAGIWQRDQIVGIIGYHHLEWANRLTCIGYWLGERFQGNGIMTKSCRSLVEYAFDEWHLNRIEIRCAAENMKSRAIPERLGFKVEGIHREAEWLYDHFVDHVVYGMLVKDWATLRTAPNATKAAIIVS